mmetsp:Transcript_32911/g.49680  ORF Transcript_32911/g.49680 Transcript_32911/m.49680 type:complete len:529 (+) Transcript_32911:64-1650(+)
MLSLKDYNKEQKNRRFSWRGIFNKQNLSLSALWIGAICLYKLKLHRQHTLNLRHLKAENEFLNLTECPSSIELAKGVYAEGNGDETLKNVVLLTASNLGYYPMLQTWESYASAANLKWAVLSLDEWIVQHRKGVNTVPTHPEFYESHSQRFSTHKYHQLECNKWRSVLSILERCQVDVVFSDVDNLFLQDPFGIDSDLGQKMRSQSHYDYIYSTNFPMSQPKQAECGNTFPKSGNNGFYFIRHDNAYLKDLIRKTLSTCREENFRFDDEEIFWNVIREAHRRQEWHHCSNETETAVDTDPVKQYLPRFCCMDPKQHKVNRRYNLEGTSNYEEKLLSKIKSSDPNVKSFHVNVGRRKIKNLLQKGLFQVPEIDEHYNPSLRQWQQPEEEDTSQSVTEQQQQAGDGVESTKQESQNLASLYSYEHAEAQERARPVQATYEQSGTQQELHQENPSSLYEQAVKNEQQQQNQKSLFVEHQEQKNPIEVIEPTKREFTSTGTGMKQVMTAEDVAQHVNQLMKSKDYKTEKKGS